jgi:biotin carboxyl carrier protein
LGATADAVAWDIWPVSMKLRAQVGSEERELVLEPTAREGRYRVLVGGNEREVDARRIDGSGWSLIIDGQAYLVDVDAGKDGELVAEIRGVTVPVKLVDPRRVALAAQRVRETSGPLDVRAPMPGKIVKVHVKAGDAVSVGQGLIVIEAMKMENELRAPRGGTVDKVRASEGQAVEAQEVLVTLV